MQVRFEPSATRPEASDRIARLQYESWSHLYPTWPFEKYVHDLTHNRWDPEHPDDMRYAWFAIDDAENVLGVAMLVANGEVEPGDAVDLEGPWFAGLVVDPLFRRQGVGEALLSFVIEHARDLGFQRLRLVTEHEAAYYERRGWTVERHVTLNSVPNTVMFITLEP